MNQFSTKMNLLLLVLSMATLTKAIDNCCSALMMDADGGAIIETEAPATAINFTVKALTVLFCSDEPVFVQLWRRNGQSRNFFTLDWQIEVALNKSLGTRERFDLPVDKQVVITTDHFLGLHSPTGSNFKIPVPFDKKDTAKLYRTVPKQMPSLRVGELVSVDPLAYPRSFKGQIVFCSEYNCPKGSENGGVKPPQVIRGPPGPPGPPGSPQFNGYLCDEPGYISTKVNDLENRTMNISRQVDSITKKNEDILATMNAVDQRIASLLSANQISGVCPDSSWIPGTLGTTYCYKVIPQHGVEASFAGAIMKCRDHFFSTLLHVELQPGIVTNEEIFLKAALSAELRDLGIAERSYWTSGMWTSKRDKKTKRLMKQWVWYDQITASKKVISNDPNWGPGPGNATHHCLLLKVYADSTKDLQWEKGFCPEVNSYVCKLGKVCV